MCRTIWLSLKSTKEILVVIPEITKKMSQSDHTTNFHDYIIISVSVAQFFAKLILSVAQLLYHKVFKLGHKIYNNKFDQKSVKK